MLSSHSVGYGISNFWYLFFISYLVQRKLLIQRTFALYEEKTFSTMVKYVSSLLLWHFLKSGIWILEKIGQNLLISKLNDSVKCIILIDFIKLSIKRLINLWISLCVYFTSIWIFYKFSNSFTTGFELSKSLLAPRFTSNTVWSTFKKKKM